MKFKNRLARGQVGNSFHSLGAAAWKTQWLKKKQVAGQCYSAPEGACILKRVAI